MIGKTISRYTILEKLGKGGMGEVFLAQDNKLHRKVALKFLFESSYADQEQKERFEREAQAAAALNHPNIVVIHEIDEFKGRVYIAMEYIEGESLRSLINKEELSMRHALDIALQICRGLSKAHEAGIVHRDMKPENILIDRDGWVKILDFGLAKLKGATSLTREGSKMGTAHYMSPEQANGEKVDQRSDIFAIGAILYELLSGGFAFRGDYDIAVIYSILNEDPEPLAHVPERLQQIVKRALAKTPANRYSSLQQMIEDLQGVQSMLGSQQQAQKPQTTLEDLAESTTGVESIEKLLQERQKIDELILNRYTENVTVMFSDVVGSTAYFERWGDVEGRAMLQRYTRLMFPIIDEHGGSVIKTIGDAILASFADPANGCRCGIAMQQSLNDFNATQLETNRFSIRISLHFGKAVIETGDIYGDVVNVASRIAKVAKADEVLLSHTVYEQIKGCPEFSVGFVAEENLRGKSEKLRLYRLILDKHRFTTKASLQGTEVKPRQSTEMESKGPLQVPAEKKESILPVAFKNPYMNRVMIKNVDEFYGRKSEVMKIYSRIGASRPQSISLVGERRMGKSSLLNYVYHPQNRMKYLKNPEDYLFIFVDFQEKRGLNIPQFIEFLHASIRREFKKPVDVEVTPSYDGFKKVVSVLDQHSLNIIMLFDEFEVITKNKNFDTEFYSYFRSIANNYNIAYIASSGRNLQDLCHSRAISDSPFFNIFSNMTVTQFTHEDALELITRPSEALGYSLEPHAPFIIDIAGYYPFFIQMACAVLFEYVKNNVKMVNATFDRVKEEFLDEAKVHFRQIWEICDDDEHRVFLSLSHGQDIPPPLNYVLKNLIKAGYVKLQNQRPAIFSSLFREFIGEEYGGKPQAWKKRRFLFWTY
ncbi:MAG: protein kinase [bacterium]